MKLNIYLIFSLAVILILMSCQSPNPESEPEATEEASTKLGVIEWNATGAEEAQPYFEQGMLLLHSFEYEDAREAFQKARGIDPDFVLAYWGEALTHHRCLWRLQDYEAGQAILDSLAPTPEARAAKAGTAFERDLLKGAEIIYGEGLKIDRDDAYAQHMEALHEKYPENQEVAALYALSLLCSVEVGRDYEVYGKSARVAKSIIAENPNHPGALHYLIHAYDDPQHAQMALSAADAYAKVAPDASHALHMPSHIYVAMGMWDDVVASNDRAYHASVDRMKEKGLTTDARDYHSFAWWQYGLLQKGQKQMAEKLLDSMVIFAEKSPNHRARAYLIDMKGRFLCETGNWLHVHNNIRVDLEDLNIGTVSFYRYTNARIAYERDRKQVVMNELAELDRAIAEAELLTTDRGVAMCSSGGSNFSLPNAQDIAIAKTHALHIQALIAEMEGDSNKAGQHLEQAYILDSERSYAYGPPDIVIPAAENYALWLHEQEKYDEALKMWDKALEKGPKRILTLKGKREAAKALGDKDMVVAITNEINEIRRSAEI